MYDIQIIYESGDKFQIAGNVNLVLRPVNMLECVTTYSYLKLFLIFINKVTTWLQALVQALVQEPLAQES